MAKSSDYFAWHIKQALYHVNIAVNTAIGDHQIGLSQVEKRILEETQKHLETLSGHE